MSEKFESFLAEADARARAKTDGMKKANGSLGAAIEAVWVARANYLGHADTCLRQRQPEGAEHQITSAGALGYAHWLLEKCHVHAAAVIPAIMKAEAALQEQAEKDERARQNRRRWAEKRRAEGS
jgi:hypothetical protein